jgi:hypothetical protein
VSDDGKDLVSRVGGIMLTQARQVTRLDRTWRLDVIPGADCRTARLDLAAPRPGGDCTRHHVGVTRFRVR